MDCARKVTKNLNWTIAIPERKQSNNVKRSSSVTSAADDTDDDLIPDIDYRDSYKSLAKLVQITDIHVDPYYEPGSEANCGEPLCCRSTNGPAKSRDRAAGAWGDYRNCDTPVPTLRHVLKHINEVHSDVSAHKWLSCKSVVIVFTFSLPLAGRILDVDGRCGSSRHLERHPARSDLPDEAGHRSHQAVRKGARLPGHWQPRRSTRQQVSQ